MIRSFFGFFWILVVPVPLLAAAQVRDRASEAEAYSPPPPPAPTDDARVGTITTDTGRIGQRQTREEAARVAGGQAMARIKNRISNRIQSRLRNRIDPNYDPQQNGSSVFAVAEDQIRNGPQSRR